MTAVRGSRRVRGTRVGALVVAAVVALPAAPAAAGPSATIDRDGWWYRARTAETPLGAPPVTLPTPPSTVPEGAVAVGAVAGEPDKVAAIGIVLDVEPGTTVERFVLRLREIQQGAATVNAAAAPIVACPITSFWAGGAAGPWETRPEADCDAASVKGSRGTDGTWTFDLAPVAAVWLDPVAAVPADGVLLQPAPGATATFQVSFAGLASGGYVLDAAFGAAPTAPEEPAGEVSPTGEERGVPVPEPAAGELGELGPVEPPSPAPTGAAAPPPTALAGPRRRAAPASVSSPIFGNLPWATLLLVPLAVALAAATMLALGEAGEPVAHVRERGVSRALAARERRGLQPGHHHGGAS